MASADSCKRNLITKPGSLMLKDYLRDELSSCSSNGFGSFPRRQCCTTTVRFLLEIDLKVKDSSAAKRFLPRSASRKLALTTISALQRASEAVIKAFKQLPFSSVVKTNSPSAKKGARKGFLPRSLSRKLLLKAFRKEADHINVVEPDTRRWKSFQEFLSDKEQPSDQNPGDSPTCTTTSTALTAASGNSISSSSNSNSWTESEFASEMMPSPSGNSESSSENIAVKGEKDSPELLIGEREGVTVGKDSMEEATTTDPEEIAKQWPREEEKEQFSPVSVLDFPFDDEDQDVSSSSCNCSLHPIEGKKQMHMQKIKRFEKVAQMEPLDLQKRFASLELHHRGFGSKSTEEHKTETEAYELLKLVKSTSCTSQCFISKTENLLLDFFHEKLEEISEAAAAADGGGGDTLEAEVLKLTEDWIDNNGKGGEMMLMEWGLQPQEGRSLFLKDMEKGGKWRYFDEEKQELASEFEAELWVSLLNELLIDLFLS